MKNVVVTGANGYIGSHLVFELLKYPGQYHVVAASRSRDHLPNDVSFVYLDIDKDACLPNLYEYLGKPDVCVHLAWRNGFQHNAVSHMTDLSNHFKLLENLANNGTKQFAVAGSFREYGSINGMVNHAASEIVPDNLYTLSKITLKRALEIQFERKGICFQWLRPFTVYGDDERNDSIMSKIIFWEKEGRESFPFTDGKEEYDYIFIDELARQIAGIISQTEIDGVIDCCSGVPTQLGVKIEEFLRNRNFKIRPQYGAFPRREYDSKVIYGDSQKIKKIMEMCKFLNS